MATRQLPQEVRALLQACTTLSLATADSEGRPAVAPLFYAVLPDDTLVFLSEEHTMHCTNLRARPAVAVAIYPQVHSWEAIRGVQALGEGFPLSEEQIAPAWEAYRRRFPFVEGGGVALRAALQRARWYGIRLRWVRLVDNARGLGWKAEWQRTHQGWERIR